MKFWQKVDCPICPAKAGGNCFFEGTMVRYAHQERQQLAKGKLGNRGCKAPTPRGPASWDEFARSLAMTDEQIVTAIHYRFLGVDNAVRAFVEENKAKRFIPEDVLRGLNVNMNAVEF